MIGMKSIVYRKKCMKIIKIICLVMNLPFLSINGLKIIYFR